MKTLIFVVSVLIASATLAAEAPQAPSTEVLQLQMSNIEKDMRIMELTYNQLKANRDAIAVEIEKRLKAAAKPSDAEKKAPTATKP